MPATIATSLSKPLSPSASLLANFRQELARFVPFSSMAAEDLDFLVTHSQQQYFAPAESIVNPSLGPVTHLYLIRQGGVTGKRGLAEISGGAFQYASVFCKTIQRFQRS